MDLVLASLESPIGAILVVSDGDYVRALEFADHEERMRRFLGARYGKVPVRAGTAAPEVALRIKRYFEGDVVALDAIAVQADGTAFQRSVWSALREIPPGTTISYGALAGRIGRPRAVRAVGAANGANPISLIIPCHRVVGANGDLTGYGGGLARKAWLLQHEARAVQGGSRTTGSPAGTTLVSSRA